MKCEGEVRFRDDETGKPIMPKERGQNRRLLRHLRGMQQERTSTELRGVRFRSFCHIRPRLQRRTVERQRHPAPDQPASLSSDASPFTAPAEMVWIARGPD